LIALTFPFPPPVPEVTYFGKLYFFTGFGYCIKSFGSGKISYYILVTGLALIPSLYSTYVFSENFVDLDCGVVPDLD